MGGSIQNGFRTEKVSTKRGTRMVVPIPGKRTIHRIYSPTSFPVFDD